MSNEQILTLGEASRLFLATLSPEEAKGSQQDISQFVRWFGTGSPLSVLSAPEVASYAERLSVSDSDYSRKAELVKSFLSYAKKQKWLTTNLAVHLKPRKTKSRISGAGRQGAGERASLTKGRYDELKAELETMKGRRDRVIVDIHKAAADKDFRENAPLEAAREEHGQVMGRIRELEETLKTATIIGGKTLVQLQKVCLGDRVVLEDTATGEELCYTIVSSREVNAGQGKISNMSPVGKAVVGQEQGRKVEVVTPGGKFIFRIKLVGR